MKPDRLGKHPTLDKALVNFIPQKWYASVPPCPAQASRAAPPGNTETALALTIIVVTLPKLGHSEPKDIKTVGFR